MLATFKMKKIAIGNFKLFFMGLGFIYNCKQKLIRILLTVGTIILIERIEL